MFHTPLGSASQARSKAVLPGDLGEVGGLGGTRQDLDQILTSILAWAGPIWPLGVVPLISPIRIAVHYQGWGKGNIFPFR